tara:strand:+ start:154 stop:585 length:432 start_codon:yes stop_codon:yes gene_type:complete
MAIALEIIKLSDLDVSAFEKLHQEIFGYCVDISRLSDHKSYLIQTACDQNEMIGFKVGMETKDDTFFSWTGGVKPEFRRSGIGSALMHAQHSEVSKLGYRLIETKCKPVWPEMMSLNLKCGLKIVQEYKSKKGETKYLLRKKL